MDSRDLDLTWITPTLAVGGCFAIDHLEVLAREHAVRAVIDLRIEDRDDEPALERHGIRFLHLPTEDGCAVSLPMLQAGVAFAGEHLARGERVLIHCARGIGRSATLALCVLVSLGMTPLEALALAKDRRARVSPSQAQYAAWVEWIEAWQPAIELPAWEAFCAIAYRHLAEGAIGTGR